MDRIKSAIIDVMTFDYKNSTIIKRTKQFIGFVISCVVLALTVGIVLCLNMFLLVIADGFVWLFTNHSREIGLVLLGLVASAGIIGLCAILATWLQSAIAKYKLGKKSWYVKGFMYSIAYPVTYIAKGFLYGCWYIICVPMIFIFYTCLFKAILAPTAKFLYGLTGVFGSTLIGSLGIFGEYFGASKKDYCPGIEWTDED
jgi:hypothetical protein